jgi:protein-glutamine gamma-glutamyltransferase
VNTPFLLLGAAVLLWGWQTGQWLVAVPCALVFEAASFVRRRWELGPERLGRISDTCVLLAGLLFAALYVALGNPRAAITQLFMWLPVVFLPLALAQAYGTHRSIELGVLFWGVRRVKQRQPTYVNIGYAYALAWTLAASTANRRDPGFELGVMALAVWALWHVRLRSRSMVLWLLLIALAGGLGYAGHKGLHDLHMWIEARAPDWIRNDDGSDTDPYRADTDIGHIGELKQSERIVMRVRTPSILMEPLLLHRASYVTYTGLRWLAPSAAFTPVPRRDSDGVWALEPQPESSSLQTASIIEETHAAAPVLSLPAGTRRIDGLPASGMKHNPLGTVLVEHPPGFLTYRASYAAGASPASGPNPDDLAVPRREARAVQEVVDALRLGAMKPRDAVAVLERYFTERFTYSLYRRAEGDAITPLAEFLQRTRSGHCEYFATATVLILRAAGIPARYATGFSVQEWSDFETAYLVRIRHAHAWASVWIDGAWHNIDTTPPVWGEMEAQAQPWWSVIADGWAWLRFQLFTMQSAQGNTSLGWTIAAALVLWMSWRMLRKWPKPARRTSSSTPALSDVPGANSAFYRIEAFVARRCSQRASGETMREWLARIQPHLSQLPARDELDALMDLHYRCRFDPAGVTTAEWSEFEARVDDWLGRARQDA